MRVFFFGVVNFLVNDGVWDLDPEQEKTSFGLLKIEVFAQGLTVCCSRLRIPFDLMVGAGLSPCRGTKRIELSEDVRGL